MAVGAKTKSPEVGAATTNFLRSISGGKVPSLIDMHGKIKSNVILIQINLV